MDALALLQRQAVALLQQGRHSEAIAVYRRLLAAKPGLADAWYNLGYLLKAEGRFDEALVAYDRALALGIAQPEEVHLNRAVIQADHRRCDAEAERELRAALAHNPDYRPALLNLGNLHEERGQREQAIACYERLLALPPTNPRDRELGSEALARLAHLRAPTQSDDLLLVSLETAATEARSEKVRANLLFALGRALDRLGEYERAFDAFVRANNSARSLSPRYDHARTRRQIEALIRTFSKAELLPTCGNTDAPEPIFICGMFRSGSTLVEQVLATHPQVTVGGELDFLPRLVRGPLSPFPATIASLRAERRATLAQAYRAQLSRLFPKAKVGTYVTDKRPDNFLLIGLIKQLFPNARIVHTVRDPLDNGLSLFMQHIDPTVASYANDLADIGQYYGQYRRLMEHWKRLYADSILDFSYDDFVTNPEPMLRRLFDFLELDWNPECLDFHRLDNTVKTASYWQVRRPLYSDASGRWRHYATYLTPLAQSLEAAGIRTPHPTG